MGLFDLKKNSKHFVQSYENPDIDGIRVYFNGEDEKKSNTNMLVYLGKEEYENIKLDFVKYKYKKEEMTESQLKSIGINPNRTAHKIYTGPNELKNEMRDVINIKKEINDIENAGKQKSEVGPIVFEEPVIETISPNKLKIKPKNNDKEININVTDDLGNASKAKGTISNSGKEIHIHINLGSSPHIEKAMLENQDAIKKLQQEFSRSLQEAKDTIKKMEEKLREKQSVYKNNFSANFESLTNHQTSSKAESAFENEKSNINKANDTLLETQIKNDSLSNVINIRPEILNKNITPVKEQIIDEIKDINNIEISHITEINNNQEKTNVEKKNIDNPNISYKEALNFANTETTESIFFRGRYQKKDDIQGHTFEEINNVSQKILKDYNKEIFAFEKKGDYSVIKNNGANKIQNYVVQKENLDKILSNSETPEELKNILEKYKNTQIEKNEKTLTKSVDNEKIMEMR